MGWLNDLGVIKILMIDTDLVNQILFEVWYYCYCEYIRLGIVFLVNQDLKKSHLNR